MSLCLRTKLDCQEYFLKHKPFRSWELRSTDPNKPLCSDPALLFSEAPSFDIFGFGDSSPIKSQTSVCINSSHWSGTKSHFRNAVYGSFMGQTRRVRAARDACLDLFLWSLKTREALVIYLFKLSDRFYADDMQLYLNSIQMTRIRVWPVRDALSNCEITSSKSWKSDFLIFFCCIIPSNPRDVQRRGLTCHHEMYTNVL